MHKNKGVGERYGYASMSYGGVDLSDLARPGLEDAARKTKKSRGVILALWLGKAAESWAEVPRATCCIPRTKKLHLQAS